MIIGKVKGGAVNFFEIYLTSCLIVCNCRFIRIRGFRFSDKVGFTVFHSFILCY